MMNEKEIEQLKKLLGPEFSSEELEAVLQEFPELLDRAESLSQAMESLRRETIPTLGPDFTDRVMARINAPSFWQKLWGAGHPVLKFGVASAVVALLAVGVYLIYPHGGGEISAPVAQGQKIYRVRFSLLRPEAGEVVLVGDFTQWNHLPLKKDKSGNFRGELNLPEGTYAYGFLVDGEKWVPDPTAHRIVPDGFGGKNSVINL
jgi:hypothetical protein